MSEIPADLKYTKSHEWVSVGGEDVVTVGITDHAQEQLGDLVYVECPEVGAQLDAEQACGVVESVKAASDIYAPIAGEVTAVNEELADSPDLINRDPYGDGWIYKLRVREPQDLGGLLDAHGYTEEIESE